MQGKTAEIICVGTELLMGAFNWLDLAPKGRNENGTMSWVKLHDQY